MLDRSAQAVKLAPETTKRRHIVAIADNRVLIANSPTIGCKRAEPDG